MSKLAFDAVYRGGAFHPTAPLTASIPEGASVHVVVENPPVAIENRPEVLDLAQRVYEGLTPEEIDEVEAIALDRRRFFEAGPQR